MLLLRLLRRCSPIFKGFIPPSLHIGRHRLLCDILGNQDATTDQIRSCPKLQSYQRCYVCLFRVIDSIYAAIPRRWLELTIRRPSERSELHLCISINIYSIAYTTRRLLRGTGRSISTVILSGRKHGSRWLRRDCPRTMPGTSPLSCCMHHVLPTLAV